MFKIFKKKDKDTDSPASGTTPPHGNGPSPMRPIQTPAGSAGSPSGSGMGVSGPSTPNGSQTMHAGSRAPQPRLSMPEPPADEEPSIFAGLNLGGAKASTPSSAAPLSTSRMRTASPAPAGSGLSDAAAASSSSSSSAFSFIGGSSTQEPEARETTSDVVSSGSESSSAFSFISSNAPAEITEEEPLAASQKDADTDVPGAASTSAFSFVQQNTPESQVQPSEGHLADHQIVSAASSPPSAPGQPVRIARRKKGPAKFSKSGSASTGDDADEEVQEETGSAVAVGRASGDTAPALGSVPADAVGAVLSSPTISTPVENTDKSTPVTSQLDSSLGNPKDQAETSDKVSFSAPLPNSSASSASSGFSASPEIIDASESSSTTDPLLERFIALHTKFSEKKLQTVSRFGPEALRRESLAFSFRKLLSDLTFLREKLAKLRVEQEAAVGGEDYIAADEISSQMDTVVDELLAAKSQLDAIQSSFEAAESSLRTGTSAVSSAFDEELYEADSIAELQKGKTDNVQRAQPPVELVAEHEKVTTLLAELVRKERHIRLDVDHVQNRRSELQSKIEATTVDMKQEKGTIVEKKSVVEEEIRILEEKLASKRSEQRSLASKLADIEAKIEQATSKFSKDMSALDREEVVLQQSLREVRDEKDGVLYAESRVVAKLEEWEERGREQRRLLTEMTTFGEDMRSELRLFSATWAKQERMFAAEAKERLDIMSKWKELERLRSLYSQSEENLKEVASKKLKAQNEISSARQNMASAESRLPELASEKKLAVEAKNFREAQRITNEIKELQTLQVEGVELVSRLQLELETLQVQTAELSRLLDSMKSQMVEAEREWDIQRIRSLQHDIRSLEAQVVSEPSVSSSLAAALCQASSDLRLECLERSRQEQVLLLSKHSLVLEDIVPAPEGVPATDPEPTSTTAAQPEHIAVVGGDSSDEPSLFDEHDQDLVVLTESSAEETAASSALSETLESVSVTDVLGQTAAVPSSKVTGEQCVHELGAEPIADGGLDGANKEQEIEDLRAKIEHFRSRRAALSESIAAFQQRVQEAVDRDDYDLAEEHQLSLNADEAEAAEIENMIAEAADELKRLLPE